jgi:2,3-bisphosphoglycerate-dependent phosphoglycerate mutase
LDSIGTCVVSQFIRTTQTAHLLLSGRPVALIVDERLNEIDYGEYEDGPFLNYGRWLHTNGPWQRPPAAQESQREAIKRMLEGLLGALFRPGPRLIVAHGPLLSVVSKTRDESRLGETFLPEAPFVSALRFTDDELRHLAERLIEQVTVDGGGRHPPGVAESIPINHGRVDRFDASKPYIAEPPEDVDRHA